MRSDAVHAHAHAAASRTAGRTRAVGNDSTWKVLPLAFFDVLFFFDFFLAIEPAVMLPPLPRPSPPPLSSFPFSCILPISQIFVFFVKKFSLILLFLTLLAS